MIKNTSKHKEQQYQTNSKTKTTTETNKKTQIEHTNRTFRKNNASQQTKANKNNN